MPNHVIIIIIVVVVVVAVNSNILSIKVKYCLVTSAENTNINLRIINSISIVPSN